MTFRDFFLILVACLAFLGAPTLPPSNLILRDVVVLRADPLPSCDGPPWPSHTPIPCKPANPAFSASACSARPAPCSLRTWLARTLLRVAGIRPFWQWCPCQKHPLTKTTAPYFGRTMSGRPGRSFLWSRKRNPRECRNRLTQSSGFVSLPRMRDMRSLRSAGVRVSAMAWQSMADRGGEIQASGLLRHVGPKTGVRVDFPTIGIMVTNELAAEAAPTGQGRTPGNPPEPMAVGGCLTRRYGDGTRIVSSDAPVALGHGRPRGAVPAGGRALVVGDAAGWVHRR